MKKIIMTLTIVIFLITGLPAYGGDNSASATYNARTGDATFDTTLGDLNVQTKGRNLSDFISNLSLSYNIPRIKIEDLLFKVKMTPADVYITVGLSKITNKPVDVVVDEYKANKGKGWGVITKRLGIKPGSKEFHDIKKGGSAQLEKVKEKGKGKEKKKSKKAKKGKKK